MLYISIFTNLLITKLAMIMAFDKQLSTKIENDTLIKLYREMTC